MTERPDPMRIVADVDVLAADLLVDGTAREAMSMIRESATLSAVCSEELLSESREIIATLGDPTLAAAWERRARADFDIVEMRGDGHGALLTAAAGRAGTVLSHDEALQSVAAGVAIREHIETSVKSPDAFVSLVDPSRFESPT